jgi:hypothetical protein
LKFVREKKQIIYKAKPIKITADSSTETLKARRAWGEVFWALNENNFNPRILYPFFLTYCNYIGALKACREESDPKLSLILACLN